LKLVAGEIHRIHPKYDLYADGMPRAAMMEGLGAGFEEESFFEYHLYTLQRPATLLNNQQKQISLLEGEGISVNKLLVFNPVTSYHYSGDTMEAKIEVRLQFMNSEANGLGIPLPKGIIRVYKKDSSGALQFIGEDMISHTPKNERIEIYMGEAFDIVGERIVLNRRQISQTVWEYDLKVIIRNHKEEDIRVNYWDKMWGDWEITTSTMEYIKKDASTAEFIIPVRKDGETELTYTIRRQW